MPMGMGFPSSSSLNTMSVPPFVSELFHGLHNVNRTLRAYTMTKHSMLTDQQLKSSKKLPT